MIERKKSKTCQQWDFGLIGNRKRRTLSAEHPTSSEFQARGEVEPITRDALGDVEVVDPACVKIEVTLTHLGRVGNDRANPEGAPDKTC